MLGKTDRRSNRIEFTVNLQLANATASIDKDKTPQELRVIVGGAEYREKYGEDSSQSTTELSIARLKFSSGVQMALPVSALSLEFLENLYRLGGKTCSQ